jgi:DUF1680 family protein
MWNWRMLAITGGARYADVMEQSLYNAILSGVNVSGKGWSYTNPLRWHGAEHELLSNDVHVRSDPGEHKICCPTNLMRTEASWNGCLYGLSEDSVWVHHYGGSRATLEMSGGGRLILIQETEYPWDGVIRLRFDQVRAQKPIKLRLRIPGWASGASLKVNGEETDSALTPSSYAEVSRSWSAGDIVELNLPMRVRLMVADPRVEQTRNQVAVQRGPVVYCLESIDLPEAVRFEDVHLRRDAKWSIRYEQEMLGGVVVLETEGVLRQGHDGSFGLYQQMPRTEPVSVPVRLIPYFAWNNRGEPRMSVWLPLAG